MATPAPALSASLGGYEVVTVPLVSRFGATAIAVVDAQRQRHRWLLATVDQAVGAPTWLGVHDGWLLGTTSSTHPEYAPAIFAVRPRDGARRVLRAPIAEGDDGLPRAYRTCDTPGEDACLRARLEGSRLAVAFCRDERRCRTEQYSLADALP